MNAHEQLEQLSLYIDGELEAAARATLEAHLATCRSCRLVLDALRATAADLALLERPQPSDLDSRALRDAVFRARRGGAAARGIARFSPAIAAAAAALVAVVAITQRSPTGTGEQALREQALTAESAMLSVVDSGASYDETTIGARLDALAAPPGLAAPVFSGAPAEDTAGGGATGPHSAARGGSPAGTGIEACAANVLGAGSGLTPVLYEIASFNGEPAYLVGFGSSERVELWVLRPSDCGVLYFAQRKLS
ncbi:MAG: zf-HC2 domain-containing protein [Acidobacteria bacterium]|nr:zf-HC2 domain-containing protein [Acidobacteriota bacterium]